MNRAVLFNIIIVFLLVSVLILLFYNVIQYRGESFQCLNNPLHYGAEKLSEETGYDFIATGSFISIGESPLVFISKYGVEFSYDLEFPPVQGNSTSNSNST